MNIWRAGGHCPLEGCNFQFMVATDDEGELDLVGTAIMAVHSARSHEGMPVSLFGFAADVEELIPQLKQDAEDDAEERPRLMN